jgi:hypothetical protein
MTTAEWSGGSANRCSLLPRPAPILPFLTPRPAPSQATIRRKVRSHLFWAASPLSISSLSFNLAASPVFALSSSSYPRIYYFAFSSLATPDRSGDTRRLSSNKMTLRRMAWPGGTASDVDGHPHSSQRHPVVRWVPESGFRAG